MTPVMLLPSKCMERAEKGDIEGTIGVSLPAVFQSDTSKNSTGRVWD